MCNLLISVVLALTTPLGSRAMVYQNGADASRNKSIVEASFMAWKTGTGSPFDLLTDDARWTIVGRSVVSKTYEGRLTVGFATPLAAAMVLSVMVVAAVSVHMRNGFFITENGFEYNLVFGVGAATLAFTGSGPWSLDALLAWDAGGNLWGLAALGLAAVGAAAQLAQRHPAVSR